jgi:WG containing repeat
MKPLLPILLFVSFSVKAQQQNFVYDWVAEFSEGVAAVGIDDKLGYIDNSGKIVIPAIYDVDGLLSNKFYKGVAIVVKDKKFGLINKKGENITDFVYGRISNFKNGLAKAYKFNTGIGYINTKGKEVIPTIYEIIVKFGDQEYNDGLVPVRKNGKIGYVDSTGNVIIPFNYNDGNSFYEGLARVEKENEIL